MVCISIWVAEAQIIRSNGSDILGARLMPQLCELYKRTHSEIAFEINAEGSTPGFTKLLDGTADIALSSRGMTTEETRRFTEKGIVVSKWAAATDAVVPAAHPENPVNQLTSKQIEAIFTGDVTDWSGVGGQPGPINLYLHRTTFGSYQDFRHLALNGRAYRKIPARFHTGDHLQSLASDPNGISVVSMAYVPAKRFKVLKIDGYEPIAAHRHLYPYFRNLWYFTSKPLGSPEHKFLEWVTRSENARDVIRKTGFLTPE